MPIHNDPTARPRPIATPSSDAAPATTTPTPTPPAPADAAADPAAHFDGTNAAPVTPPVGSTPAAPGSVAPWLACFGSVDLTSPQAAMLMLAARPLLDGLPPLDTPDGQKALSARLEASMGALMADPTRRADVEKQVVGVLVQLSMSGQLEPVLDELAKQAAATGALPPLTDEKRGELVAQLAGMVQAELLARGLVPGATAQPFESWEVISRRHLAMARDTAVPPAGPGSASALTNPAFVGELEALQGAPFLEGNAVKPLIDGPASFAERARLIDGAEKSIHLMSWAFYDDDTGWATARKLVEKAAEGVEVRIIVDEQVGSRSAHDDVIKFLAEHGVQVLRWRDAERPFDGQHRKVMIVDGVSAIAGGLNVGDAYSHQGPPDKPRWRDTDVLVEGRGARAAEELFARVWNRQVETRGLPLDPLDMPTDPSSPAVGGARVAVVDHEPGKDAHILLATVKAIEGATSRIDIENAYFISTPEIREALLAALARGVKVRLLTNSAESVDEPIVTAPILASLPELVEAGAEIYLKQGDTLHSKMLVVDDVYAQVGSYNLHPRSHRYEHEMTMSMIDEGVAQGLTRAFEADIAAATRVRAASDIVVPKSAFTMIASTYFFDQL